MRIDLSIDLEKLDVSEFPHFLITKDRYFVVSHLYEFDYVPTVKYTEDDCYETTERQCVNSHSEIIAVFDNIDEAVFFRDCEMKLYLELLEMCNYSEEFSRVRCDIFVYNESEKEFEVKENV